jgi:regulator of replication initiation timing
MASNKAKTLEQRVKEIQKELSALKKFRKTKQRDQFVRQLVGEQSYLKRQLSRLASLPKRVTKREKQRRLSRANKQRRIKMKRSYDYFRAIQKNYYPDMSLRQIRSLFKKHREGLETDVSDIAWRNPSP